MPVVLKNSLEKIAVEIPGRPWAVALIGVEIIPVHERGRTGCYVITGEGADIDALLVHALAFTTDIVSLGRLEDL